MDKIVIIEDDPGIRTILKLALRSAGFPNVHEAERGDTGLEMVFREKPALVLLDLMLPGVDGLTICRRIRETPSTAAIPIIMLTAKTSEDDIVKGLEMGADDYVTKPFSKTVLLARIKAVLRRPAACVDTLHSLDGLSLDDSAYTVTLNGKTLDLTRMEFSLLRLFIKHQGRVYTRAQIIDLTQDEDKAVTDRTVDTQMVGLRRKLGTWASHIETIRGIGYRMNP
jgi:two-component system, OmpR family, alkaline phosphatase synthesis response regulator PhoP